MNKYLIYCYTNWCREEEYYSAIANNELELEDIAEELAYELFESYDGISKILDELGYSEDELDDEELDKILMSIDESEYYGYNIELVNESDSEQLEMWKSCELVYDGILAVNGVKVK